MKIACMDQEIRKILSANYYKIPRFQRPYSWDRDNIEEFWKDVTSNKAGNYFIGSMVVYIKGDSRYIIDGQQRLTTITIFLAVLRDKFKGLGYENLAHGIHALIERNDLNNDPQYVVQTWTSYPFFQKQIQSLEKSKKEVAPGDEEINLQIAYDLLTQLLDKEVLSLGSPDGVKKRLEEIRKALLALKIIYVEVDNEDDAYTIFETLNTRGKDLTTSDLLKNHLAKLWKNQNTRNDLIKINWHSIRQHLDKIDAADVTMDSFLYHHWLATRELTTEKELFKRAKAVVKTKEDAKLFLEELIESAEIYSYIFVPRSKEWKKEELPILRSLEALISFRVRQPLPMLLALLKSLQEGGIKRKEAERAFKAIELFHFAFTALTSQRSSGGISHMYASHARELSQAKTPVDRKNAINELVGKLRARLPAKPTFKDKFLDLKYSDRHPRDKRTVQYVLRHLYDLQNPSVVVDHDHMSIEHIEPQSSKLVSLIDVANIGNLWLLSSAQNNKFGNESVATKIPAYKNIGVVVDPILGSAVNSWTGADIEKRAEHLEEKMWDSVQSL